MPSAPPTSRSALLAPDAMPCSCGRTLDMTRLEAGAKKRAMPTPLMIRAGELRGVGGVGGDHAGEVAEPDGLEEETGGDDRAAADPVGQDAGDRGDEHRHAGPGQHAQAGLGGRVAEHALHVLAEQEDRAEHPEEHQQAGRVDPGEGAERKSRIGSIGFFARVPWTTKATSSAPPATSPVRT